MLPILADASVRQALGRPRRFTFILDTRQCPRQQSIHVSTPSSTSSVDATEVSHFNALASTWWDVNGSSRLLHLMNPLRHDFIASCVSSAYSPAPHDGLRYLDVGCGGGIFAESAARLPHTETVLGIDPSADVIRVAQQHVLQDPALVPETGRLTYRQTSIESLPRPRSVQDQFDVLALFEVIEHVSHPAAFLTACLPFVKPGGWLILSTIARTWTSWFTTKVVAEHLVGLVPRGTHDWTKYINELELKNWFANQSGWGRNRSLGLLYLPGLGWRPQQFPGTRSDQWGNYFFGVRKDDHHQL